MAIAPEHIEMWVWVFLASFFPTTLFLWLAGLPCHRLSGQAHWSERARLLFLPRITFALMMIWVPMGTVLMLRDDWPMGKWASLGLGLTALLGCLLGEMLGMSGLSLPPAAQTPRPGARIARGMILMPGCMLALFPSLIVSFGLVPGLLVMMAAFLGSRFLGKWVRRAEVDADAIAMGQATEEDPGCYARVLERIHQENLLPAAMAQRTTHPDLYDRMVQAGVTPDFPRPLPARKFPGVVLALMAAVLAGAIVKLAMPDPPPGKRGRGSLPTAVLPDRVEVDR